MTRIQSPYTYVPGDSLLHKWSAPIDLAGNSAPYWSLRFASKMAIFFVLFFSVARLHLWLGASLAFLSHIFMLTLCLGALGMTCGPDRTKLMARELMTIVKLGVLVGFPVYLCAIRLGAVLGVTDDPGVMHTLLSFLLMIALVCATLTSAALYLSTTSLGCLLRRIRGPLFFRTVVAVAFTNVPRFDEAIKSAYLAFDSLGRPEFRFGWRVIPRLPGMLLSECRRSFLLICAGVWSILTHQGMRLLLAVAERDQDRSSNQ